MLEEKLAVWRLRRGRVEALRWIYDRYKKDLLGLAVMMAGDVDQAEDAVQDVFLKLAQSCGRISLRGCVRNYLITCLVNQIRTLKRQGSRRFELSSDSTSTHISEIHPPEHWAILNERMQGLCQAMRQLPSEQCEVVTLRFHAGLRFPQIARIQNVSVNTVQGRYRYGIEKLRSLLNGEVTR